MMKMAVVYWSGTGNTEQMALAVAEGAREKGAETPVLMASEFEAGDLPRYDALAFGCPSMGAEVLEEEEFQPLWDACLPGLKDKRLALFGSYGWGDGEWMREWESACARAGLSLKHESVICKEAPDALAIDLCRALGASLAE